MTGTALERVPDRVFASLEKRASVLASSSLVPTALRDKPADVLLVMALGEEIGVPAVQALSKIHVIEGSPSPSVQLRVELATRAGHEVRLVESTSERCIVRGRRRDDRGDQDAWVTVTWTIDDARRAGLLDEWVDKWERSDGKWKVAEKLLLVRGDDGTFHPAGDAKADLPEWARKQLAAGKLKRRDNWHRYPADMLYARAAARLCKLLFGDTMLGALPASDDVLDRLADVEPDVADERHVAGEDSDDDVVDAELVDDEHGSPDEGVAGTDGGEPGPPGKDEAGTAARRPAPDGVPTEASAGESEGPQPSPASDSPAGPPPWCADLHRFAAKVFAGLTKSHRDLCLDAVVAVVTGGRTTSTRELGGQMEANRVMRRLSDVRDGLVTMVLDNDRLSVRQGDDSVDFDVVDGALHLRSAA